MRTLGVLAASAALLLTSATAFAQTPPANAQPPPKDRLLPVERRGPVPYEDQQGVVLFQMLVGDRGVWALLDTALPVSLIDEQLARDTGLSLESVPATLQTPEGKSQAIWRAKDVPLTVPGQFKITLSQLRATDLAPLMARLDQRVAFVFGQDFLRQMVVMINPERHAFDLAPTGVVTGGPLGSVELALKPGTPTTTISVGDKSLVVALSTATRFDLCLSPAAWTSLSSSISEVSSPSAADGANRQAKLKEVTFAGGKLENLNICEESRAEDGRDGTVGYGLLSRFNFAMDTTLGKTWLQPISRTGAATSGGAN